VQPRPRDDAGHCHSGMLAGARSIVKQHFGTLEALLKQHVG
jgi:hypothetical protein